MAAFVMIKLMMTLNSYIYKACVLCIKLFLLKPCYVVTFMIMIVFTTFVVTIIIFFWCF